MTQNLFTLVGPHPANGNLAVLTYSGHERPVDVGLLIFAGIMWVFYLVRAIRGWQNRPRAKQTKNAAAMLPVIAFLMLGLILGLVFVHK